MVVQNTCEGGSLTVKEKMVNTPIIMIYSNYTY